MENDTIRTSGGKTFVDVWIEGKVRGICVGRGTVEAYLGLSSDRGSMTDEERCEFVRTNMALVMEAATQRLRESPATEDIVIEPGQLGSTAGRGGGDRRKTERRKSERRKADRPDRIPPTGDRRKADRRKSERRAKPKEA